jgi:hypothetical protein
MACLLEPRGHRQDRKPARPVTVTVSDEHTKADIALPRTRCGIACT